MALLKDLEFMTKPEIATEMLIELLKLGYFNVKWIGCDSVYGTNQDFLDNIPEGIYYFANVDKTTSVFTINEDGSIGESISVAKLAKDDSINWQKTYLCEGTKEPVMSETACIRVYDTRNGKANKEVWFYLRKYDNKIKYFLSDAPKDIERKELDQACIMRWPIEQTFNECKDQLGMDEYQLRSWNGWHRHMLLISMMKLFLHEVQMKFTRNNNPVISLRMARKLVASSLGVILLTIEKTIEQVDYYLKKNNAAYESHKKKLE